MLTHESVSIESSHGSTRARLCHTCHDGIARRLAQVIMPDLERFIDRSVLTKQLQNVLTCSLAIQIGQEDHSRGVLLELGWQRGQVHVNHYNSGQGRGVTVLRGIVAILRRRVFISLTILEIARDLYRRIKRQRQQARQVLFDLFDSRVIVIGQ